MDDEFDILAAKVLAGDASPAEYARFEELLRQSCDKRQEFDELTTTWKLLHAVAPVIHAMEAPPVQIPENRLRRLLVGVTPTLPPERDNLTASNLSRLERRPYAGAYLWRLAAALIFIACVASILFIATRPRPVTVAVPPTDSTCAYLLATHGQPEVRRAGGTQPSGVVTALRIEDEIQMPAGASATLITSNGATVLKGPRLLPVRDLAAISTLSDTNAPGPILLTVLFSPARQLLAVSLLVTTRGAGTIPLYSPIGATANLTPLILWRTEPGKTYDILITDEFNPTTPPWRLSGVVSPVNFDTIAPWQGRTLSKDGLYRLRLSETAGPLTASDYTFRTLSRVDPPLPASPTEALLNAFYILASDSSRVGDALANLLTLPAGLAKSELALRLKLLAFGQLGYQADFEEAASALQMAR